jgi:hypothetical protein
MPSSLRTLPAAFSLSRPAVQGPAAPPGLLIFIAARISLAGPGFHIVEPHIFGAGAVGLRLLAGHRTGVATNALVQVHHHAHLGHDSHQYCTSWPGALFQGLIPGSGRQHDVGELGRRRHQEVSR